MQNGKIIKQYAYNIESDDIYNALLAHTFEHNCSSLDNLIPVYYVLAALWVVISAIWWLYTFVYRKVHSMYI